jgi:peptidoglycan/LPS O-acetylase OafA/YrhL
VPGILIALSNSAASIITEKLIKSGAFSESLFWLSAWATIFSVVSFPIIAILNIPVNATTKTRVSLQEPIIYAVISAGVGLSAAAILRQKSNIILITGKVASLPLAVWSLWYVSAEWRLWHMTSCTRVAGLATVVWPWIYDHYNTCGEDSSSGPLTTAIYRSLDNSMKFDIQLPGDSAEKPYTDVVEGNDTQFDMELDNLASIDVPLNHQNALASKKFIPPSRLSISETIDILTFGLITELPPLGYSGIYLFRRGLLVLLPSFVFIGRKDNTKTKPIHPTAYLDGVRGMAAFLVFIFHMIIIFFPSLLLGWKPPARTNFFQLPWIRLVTAGHGMVAVFFVVSGFSISVGPLKRIRSGDMNTFNSSIASSIFRRWLRLYVPCLVMSFIIMVVVYTEGDNGLLGVVKLPTFTDQFWDWYYDVLFMTFPLRTIDINNWQQMGSKYVSQLWTVPIEFQGSMIVYTSLVAFSKLREKPRIALNVILALISLYYVQWHISLFMMGIVLGELHLIRRAREANQSLDTSERETLNRSISTLSSLASIFHTGYWLAHFLFAAYILSMQGREIYQFGEEDPGFAWLWFLIPTQYATPLHWFRFWPTIGAIYFVYSIDNCKLAQRIFTTRFFQYLGFISFALYLVHVQLIYIHWFPVLEKTWLWSGKATNPEYTLGFFIGFVICLPFMFWASDLFARAVDVPSVNFAKWVYEKLQK